MAKHGRICIRRQEPVGPVLHSRQELGGTALSWVGGRRRCPGMCGAIARGSRFVGGDALFDGGDGPEDRQGRREEGCKTLKRACSAVVAGMVGATSQSSICSADARQTIQIQTQQRQGRFAAQRTTPRKSDPPKTKPPVKRAAEKSVPMTAQPTAAVESGTDAGSRGVAGFGLGFILMLLAVR